jgi:hypothetical protein
MMVGVRVRSGGARSTVEREGERDEGEKDVLCWL